MLSNTLTVTRQLKWKSESKGDTLEQRVSTNTLKSGIAKTISNGGHDQSERQLSKITKRYHIGYQANGAGNKKYGHYGKRSV